MKQKEKEKTMKQLELKTKYDPRKSFYNKAYITLNDNNLNKVISLYSYKTYIMSICKTYIHFVKDEKLYTPTTLRHIRELIKQYAGSENIPKITKKIIIKNNYVFSNVFNKFRSDIYYNPNQLSERNYK